MTTNLFLTFHQDNDKSFTAISIHVASLRIKFDETWLNEHDDISLFNLNDCNCISQGKTCSQRGGLTIYLNDNLTYKSVKCPKISILWECQVIVITSKCSLE